MKTNLVYVFLDSAFSKANNNLFSDYVYNQMPDYYNKTLNVNSKKVNSSHLITNLDKSITLLTDDPDFKYVNSLISEKWHYNRNNPFWYNTLIRVILLCIYIRNNSLVNTIHVEADNIIYSNDVNSVIQLFNPGEFGFGSVGRYSSAPGIIFIKDETAADSLLKQHIKLFEKGERDLIPYVGHFGHNVMDMALLDIIRRYNVNYRELPILPYGEASNNFDKFNCVFDPASYGQYLAGTNNGHEKGFIDPSHFIGQEFLKKNISVVMENNTPFVLSNNTKIPIFNLHIHNKKAIDYFL